MKFNTLIARDPALAALVGLGSSDFGADFGDEFGYNGVDAFGQDPGYAPAGIMQQPTQADLLAAWKQQQMANESAYKRYRIMRPNEGSPIKVERYVFTMSQDITLQTAVALNITDQPDAEIRPQRVVMNAPMPWFAFIDEIKVANVSVSLGSGREDAFNYNANGVGQALDMPTLTPANRATVLGDYTGLVPPGMVGATAGVFSVSFRGPARLAGG